MTDSEPIRRGGQQYVTASQLVRHFGLWQERAARAPVYIMHRGRPRYALTSIDVMEALSSLASPATDDSALATLLEARGDIMMIFDRDGCVVLASLAARARFGAAIQAGARPTGLALAGGQMLEDAIMRVSAGGSAESIEIVPDAFRARRLRCDLSPFPNGCLLHATDITTEQELANARARLLASNMANALAEVVNLRLSLRGHIISPPRELSALTGIATDALASARFTSLLTVASRVAPGEAIDAVANGDPPRRINAECLVHGAAPLPVAIGIAGVTISGRIEELAVTLAPAPA